MVNLIDKDNVTVDELEKAGQLAIVVNNQQELKGLVENINKIIEEKGINLNKKVIFILPKSQKDKSDEWKNNDFPLYFDNNNYFGLYYADADELNDENKLKTKLNKKVYTDQAFEDSAAYDVIINKDAVAGDIDKVIERVKLYTYAEYAADRDKLFSQDSTGEEIDKLKGKIENPYKEKLTKDNFKELANLLDIELSRKLSTQKTDEYLISLAKTLDTKSDKTRDEINTNEDVNNLIKQRERINHLKDYHDRIIEKLEYTTEDTTKDTTKDTTPTELPAVIITTKPLTKTLDPKKKEEFLKLKSGYMGLNIDCSYEFTDGKLIFTVNKVNEHGLGSHAGFKVKDKITYEGLLHNDEILVNIVNELRKGNLLGGEVSRVEDGGAIKTTKDFQDKIDNVRFDDEASTEGSLAYNILFANKSIIKTLDNKHIALIKALGKAEERATAAEERAEAARKAEEEAKKAAAAEAARKAEEERLVAEAAAAAATKIQSAIRGRQVRKATAAARAAQAEAETRAEAAETSLAEAKKAAEEARAAKAEAEQRLAEAAREAQAEAAREAAEEKAAREEAAEEKAARLAAEAATAAEVARAAREAQAEAARAAQAEAEQRLAEEATAAEAARKAEEEKAEAAVARETAEAAARAAAERLVEVEAELAGVREELQKVLTEAEAAKKAAEEKAVREGAAREGAVREAAEEARAARAAAAAAREAAEKKAAREEAAKKAAEEKAAREEAAKKAAEEKAARLAAEAAREAEAARAAQAEAAREAEAARAAQAEAARAAQAEAEQRLAAEAARAAAETKAVALDNLTIEMERYQEGLRNDVKNIDKLLKLASQQKQAIVSMSATSTQEHRVKVAKVGIKVVVDYVIKLIIMDKEDNLNGETYSETSRKLDKLTLEHYMDSCFIGNAMGNVTQEYNSICNFIKGKKDIHEIVNKDIDDNLCKRLEENPKRTVEILLKASKDYNEAMKEAVKKYTQDVVNQFKTGARRIQHQVETKTTFLSEINGSGPEPSSSPGSASAATTTPVPVNRLR